MIKMNINFTVQNKKTYDKKEVLFIPYHIEFKKVLEKFNEKDSSFIEYYIKETKFKQEDSSILKLPEMNSYILLKGIKILDEDIIKSIKSYCRRIETLVFDLEMFEYLNVKKELLIHLIVKASILSTYKGLEENNFLEGEKLKNIILNVSEEKVEDTKKILHEAIKLYTSTLKGIKFSNKILLEELRIEKIVEELKKNIPKKTKIKFYKNKEIKAQKLNSVLKLQSYFLEEPIIYILEQNFERGKNTVITGVLHLDFDEKNNFKEYHVLSLIKGLQEGLEEHYNVTLMFLLLKTKNTNRLLGKKIKSASGIEYTVNNKEDLKKVLLSDLMFLASKQKPRQIISLNSTCFKPLGTKYIPFFTNSDFLSKKLLEAGEKALEKTWRLPLEKHFDKKNFEFKKEENYNISILESNAQGYTWMYIDFPKTFEEKNKILEFYPRGNTGIGVALLKEYLKIIHKKK